MNAVDTMPKIFFNKKKQYNKNIEMSELNPVPNKYKNITGNINVVKSFRPYNEHYNNLNENRGSLYKNNIPQNMNKLSRMIEVVHKYYGILDEDIKELFEELFKDFFRQNIKNKLSIKHNIERKIIIKRKINNENNENNENTYNIQQYTLIPEIYYDNIIGNLIIGDNSEIFNGTFGTVYKSIFSKTTQKKLVSTILKIIKENRYNTEFKSLIFNICFISYLYLKNNDGIKYFCDLYEFGKIKEDNNKFYAIMEDGGYDILNFFFKNEIFMKKNIIYNKKLYIVLYIIRECATALKVLHDNNIAHNDIKPENFVITKYNGHYYIKIIDFGYCKKFGTIVKEVIGTTGYVSYNFYYQIKINKQYIINKNNDIYALGILFLDLLCGMSIFYMSKNDINCYNFLKELKKLSYIDPNILQKKIIIINCIMHFFKRNIKSDKKNIPNTNTKIDNLELLLVNILNKITYIEKEGYEDLSNFIFDIDILINQLIELYKLN